MVTATKSKSRFGGGMFPGTERGLTLVEMMVTMAIFGLVTIALLYGHIFGLRQDQLVESKLGASDTARRGFSKISNEIRAAKNWQIGNMSGMTYVDLPDGTNQIGRALQLSLVTNSTPMVAPYILYYFTNISGDNKLCRFHTGDPAPTIIASNLIDTLTFVGEDYTGTNVITTLQQRYVIHFTLKFQQYLYPLTTIGSNSLFDLYKIEFRLTPHAPS